MQDRLQVTSVGYSPFRYVGRGGSVVECLPSGGSQIRRLVRALLSSSRGGALCLVFSSTFLDPRVGRFMDKSTPLSSVSLSLVFFNRSSNGIQVHSSMLSIHRILGFPCFLAPDVVPCMISSDNLLLFSLRVQSMIISFF